MILGIFAIALISSVWNDSLTTDECSNIATGYKVYNEKSARTGFEHTPLVRTLAILPIIPLSVIPPKTFITEDIKGKTYEYSWSFCDAFIYGQTNPDRMIFLARLPMIFITCLLGFFVYLITLRLWSAKAAILALILYTLNPFFLGHGRIVVADVPSALGALIGIYYFCEFLRKPTIRNILFFGILQGFIQLIKYPLTALVPVYFVMLLLWVFAHTNTKKAFLTESWSIFWRLSISAVIALVVICFAYRLELIGYPIDQHTSDMTDVFNKVRPDTVAKVQWLINLTKSEITRPLAHYLYGLIVQTSRSGGFGYYMGEGSMTSWISFYPVGYFLKHPLGFHFLTLIALVSVLLSLYGELRANLQNKVDWFKGYVRNHTFIVASWGWILLFAYILMFVNTANTGSRYIIPILPFLCILIASRIVHWISNPKQNRALKASIVLVLLISTFFSLANNYPSFLAYFNELVGPDEGSYYLVDTDADWGQDMKRLGQWITEKNIRSIKVAHQAEFEEVASGAKGSSWVFTRAFAYYLKDRYSPYVLGDKPQGWLAVPVRLVRWGMTSPATKKGWKSTSYSWLRKQKPIANIGHSIFIYYVE